MRPSAPSHPRAEPYVWPLVAVGAILFLQVVLLQVALNRLSWGMYDEVFAPAVAAFALSAASWLVYRQVNGGD